MTKLSRPMMANTLELNSVLVDWLTLTSFEDSATQFYEKIIQDIERVENREDSSWMQYKGVNYRLDNGHAFIGTAVQGGRMHYVLTVGGHSAHMVYERVGHAVREGWIRPTRMDIQVTVSIDKEWSQWRLFNRLKKKGMNVSYISSRSGAYGGELATVYVGSRQSDRVIRIYEKDDKDGKKFLRFEAEYKGNRSRQMLSSLCRGDGELSSYMEFERQRIDDKELSKLYGFMSSYNPESVKISRVVTNDKTESWLRGSVIPAIVRYVNSHDADISLIKALQQATIPDDI